MNIKFHHLWQRNGFAIKSLPAKFICTLLRLYQCSMSAWIGPACRFEPSCSHYAHEAISRHGVILGANLALRRILRCRPFGGFGYDPVPEKIKENSHV